MASVKVYSTGASSTATLPGKYAVKINEALLAQAMRVYADGKHPRLAKTQTRSEVNRSKRKIYRQKGTGGARHGAKSAPIFIGGGKAHGPDGRKKKLSLPRKFRTLSKDMAIARLAQNERLVFVSGLTKIAKTKDAQELVNKIKKDYPRMRRLVVALADSEAEKIRFFKNLESVKAVLESRLNTYQILRASVLAISKQKPSVAKKTTKKETKK